MRALPPAETAPPAVMLRVPVPKLPMRSSPVLVQVEPVPVDGDGAGGGGGVGNKAVDVGDVAAGGDGHGGVEGFADGERAVDVPGVGGGWRGEDVAGERDRGVGGREGDGEEREECRREEKWLGDRIVGAKDETDDETNDGAKDGV